MAVIVSLAGGALPTAKRDRVDLVRGGDRLELDFSSDSADRTVSAVGPAWTDERTGRRSGGIERRIERAGRQPLADLLVGQAAQFAGAGDEIGLGIQFVTFGALDHGHRDHRHLAPETQRRG